MTRHDTRPLTLRDVSEASGVSEMTVSRVLRNRGDVSETTRARVLEAAKTLGYVPNKIAGALASQRVNLVAVIIPSISNMVFPEVMAGINDALEETGLQPVVGITGYSPEKEEKVLYEMLSWRPSGVIVAGLEHSDASRAMLRASGIPVVEIMDTDGTPIDSVVGISHRRAGQQMAQAILRELGVLLQLLKVAAKSGHLSVALVAQVAHVLVALFNCRGHATHLRDNLCLLSSELSDASRHRRDGSEVPAHSEHVFAHVVTHFLQDGRRAGIVA